MFPAGTARSKRLKSIDLRIDKGEIVTLIGANGAGKSTTLRKHHRAGARRLPAKWSSKAGS